MNTGYRGFTFLVRGKKKKKCKGLRRLIKKFIYETFVLTCAMTFIISLILSLPALFPRDISTKSNGDYYRGEMALAQEKAPRVIKNEERNLTISDEGLLFLKQRIGKSKKNVGPLEITTSYEDKAGMYQVQISSRNLRFSSKGTGQTKEQAFLNAVFALEPRL